MHSVEYSGAKLGINFHLQKKIEAENLTFCFDFWAIAVYLTMTFIVPLCCPAFSFTI